MTDLAHMTVAELLAGAKPDYYSPEHNPLGSRDQWAAACRAGLFPCAKIGRRWLARVADFDTWFAAQTARPDEDPLEALARSAGVKARRCA